MSKRKHLTTEEEEKVEEYWRLGMTDKQIGAKINRHWRSIQNIRNKRGLTRDKRKEMKERVATTPLEKMSKGDRGTYLREKFKSSKRLRMMMETMSQDEFGVFQEEYFKIADDIDDMTHSEEQQLSLATYELVLALKAQKNRSDEERLVNETRQGLHGKSPKDDPDYRTYISDRWEKEYKQHMDSFGKLYEALKLNRQQRLADEMKLKKSFLDYALLYSERSHQEVAAQEILDLVKKEDDELKRLIENGWLYGSFGLEASAKEDDKDAEEAKKESDSNGEINARETG